MNFDAIQEILKGFFSEKAGIISVILFGSFASGKYTERSDLDIAILFKHERIPGTWDLLDLQENLNGIVSRNVWLQNSAGT